MNLQLKKDISATAETTRQTRHRLARPLIIIAASFAASALSAPLWAVTIQGTTFMDRNDNGLKDSGEPPLLTKPTLFIRHNPTADAGEGGFYTTEADENGNYSFILYDTGSYTIWSEMPHGWHQTAPARGQGIAFYDFSVANNEQTVTIDFGFLEPTAHNGPQTPDNSTSSAPNTTDSAPTTEPTSPAPTEDKADVTPTSGSDNTPSAPTWNGTVQGTTFMDENNNGLKDSGEPALLTKTTIFIKHNPTVDAGEGGLYTTETDENGNYSFILYDTGSYTIWSEMPHGWHQTAPIRGEGIAFYDFTVSNNEQTVTIDFGFIEPTAHNGPEMPDNPTSPAPNNNTTESAPNTNPTSPTPTPTDDKADVTPTSGSDNTPSAPTWNGTVQGTTFMDENNNGLKDSGDPAHLTKTTLFIRHNPTADAGEGGFYTTETDENGNYSFILYDTGSYTIWAGMPHGWHQTAPIRGEGIAFYDFTLSNNQQAVTIDFGFIEPTADNGPQMPDNPTSPAPNNNTTEPAPNTEPTPPAPTDDKADVTPTSGSDNTPSAPIWNGTVQGTTFMDENNNGLKDSGEAPLLTKTTLFIRHNPTADAGGEDGFYTTETDENGNYSFILYDTGSYTIWAGMPHGWHQTTPARGEGIAIYDFTVSNNDQTVTIDFGFIEPTADNGPPQPNKTPYSAEFSHTQHIIGEPNTQLPISLALFNTGPNNDTYTINVANTAAWALTSSEQTLTIKSQQRENLELNITLPSTHGAETRITVTAQSQNDPKVEAVATFSVSVTAQQLTTTPRGDEEADLTLVIEDTALMAGENLKIANALENILAADIDAKTLLTFELITFKGNNIVSRLVTQDMGELIGLLRSLIPAGGDDCANASIAALDSALPYIYKGQILLATAASAGVVAYGADVVAK
jgi:hypothetical protein